MLGLPNPYVILGGAVAGLLLLLGAFAGGWHVRALKADSDALAATQALMEAKDAGQARLNAKSAEFETFRASLEPQRTQGRTIIEKEYHDVPVPADCALRPDALGVLESARQRANAAATGQSGEPVPNGAADPPARP